MAEYYIGNIRQAVQQNGELEWAAPIKDLTNEIKWTSITEIDCTLDTSRFQFCIPIQGLEPYLLNNQTYLISPEEYFVLNPHQEARAEGRAMQAMEGFCIFLSPKTIQEVASHLQTPLRKSLSDPFHFSWQQQEFIIKPYRLSENTFGDFVGKIKNSMLAQKAPIIEDWDHFYYQLANHFLIAHQEIGTHLRSIPASSQSTKQEIYHRLAIAHAYLNECYDQPLSLDLLSRKALLSKFHLVRLYQKVYGTTPYQQLLQIRIEKAKELLLKGYSPTEIAYALAFSDRRSFSKAFKRIVGIAPSYFAISNTKN